MTNDERNELDGLIAEKVFGWSDAYGRFGDPHIEGIRLQRVPEYCTDIAAAWSVHLAMKEQCYSKRCRYTCSLQDFVSDRIGLDGILRVHMQDLWFHVTPEDICRAALKAMG